MLDKVKYSQELGYMAETYIIDGVCVKSRHRKIEDVTEEDIITDMANHKNISIQNGDKIDIYCDEIFADRLRSYMKYASSAAAASRAYQEGRIELHVK